MVFSDGMTWIEPKVTFNNMGTYHFFVFKPSNRSLFTVRIFGLTVLTYYSQTENANIKIFLCTKYQHTIFQKQ